MDMWKYVSLVLKVCMGQENSEEKKIFVLL